MRHTRTWLYAFLPFLYLAIVLGLTAVQFSKKSDSFSQSLGDLTVSGKTSSGGQPSDLSLRGRGLEFVFDAAHALVAEGADGANAKLRPLSWGWKDGDVVVQFQEGLELSFEKSPGTGRSLLIHPVANEALKKWTSLRIPFGPQAGARITRPAGDSVALVEKADARLLATVDGAQDRIDPENAFVLTRGPSGFRAARLDPLPQGLSPTLGALTLDAPASPADAEAALTQWWDKAYASWPTRTEATAALVVAWSQEALARGEYPAAAPKIQALVARNPEVRTFDASPILGNIVDLTAQERRAVEAASSRAQPDWASLPTLWSDARRYGPSGSARRVEELLLTGNLPEDLPSLVSVAVNLRALAAVKASTEVSDRIDQVDQLLANLTVRREGQLYLRNGEGLLDLRSSLLVGRLWLQKAQVLANEAWGTAGARLVLSALARAGADGKLPAFLVDQGDVSSRTEGTLWPEALYQLVHPAPALETDVTGLASGAFLRSLVPPVAQTADETSAQFTFRFPVGSAEHLVIVGVPAFDHITMHGIRWRTDPQFQSYTDGWYYSASTQTLFVKIKHREEQEDLVISFRPGS